LIALIRESLLCALFPEPDFELCVDVVANKQTVVELDFDTAARTWMPLQRAPVWMPLQSGSSTRRSGFIGRARQS